MSFREGGNYEIRGDGIDQIYACLRREAEIAPNRARSIVWLLLRAMDETRELRITVRTVRPDGAHWLVSFFLDSNRAWQQKIDDTDVFLSRSRDYTTVRDELGAGVVMMPFEEDLEAARKRAREGDIAPQREAIQELVSQAGDCQRAMKSMKARSLLKRAQRDLEAAERALMSELAVHCSTRTAPDGSHGEAERPSRGTSLATPEAA